MSAELRIDPELEAALNITETELHHVRQLIDIRGRTERMTTDELEVLARLADLKLQAYGV